MRSRFATGVKSHSVTAVSRGRGRNPHRGRNYLRPWDPHAMARRLQSRPIMESQLKSVSREEPARGAGVDLEPETILPAQYFSSVQLDASLQPEKRLMLAVLEDAVGTFQKLVQARDRRA